MEMLIVKLQVDIKALKDQLVSGGLTPNIKFIGQIEPEKPIEEVKEEPRSETMSEANTTSSSIKATQEATEELISA